MCLDCYKIKTVKINGRDIFLSRISCVIALQNGNAFETSRISNYSKTANAEKSKSSESNTI